MIEEKFKIRHPLFLRIFNWSIANKFLTLIFLSLSFYYLVSINDLTIKGFKLTELRSQISYLQEANQKIGNSMMALESYQNLQQRAEGLNMVAVNEVDYITINPEIVAKR